MAFLSPFLLPLLALASVPIIIHLLNRRRFKLIEWAPMKYLKLTIKTNRRRLRIEQLILLAIRTLIVALVIVAVCRPILSRGRLGNWLSGRGSASRFIVIDDSLSMGYRNSGRSAFENAKEATAAILKSIGTQDSVTVLTTSAPGAPLIHEAHLDDPAKVVALTREIPHSDTASDWPATFRALGDLLTGATFPQREIVVVTDLRKSGWTPPVTELAQHWAQSKEQRLTLKIIDVGSRQTANVALAAFEIEDPVALPGAPIRLKAQIRNDTNAPVTGAQATLTVGGEPRPVMLPEIAAGQTIDLPLTVTPEKPGQIPLRLALPDDALPEDNVRHLCLTVRPTIDLLLVDGQPSAQPFESETDFLTLAFTIGNDPWHVKRATDAEWNAASIAPADVIVLANLTSVSPQRVKELERLVADGAGLMIFCGEQIDTHLYNQRMYRESAGLLPARLDGAIDGPVNGIIVESVQNSPLEPLGKLAPGALARVRVNRYMGAGIDSHAKDVRVLARWNNSEASPAVIEKRFGRGRVLLFTTSANKAWTDWPLDPTYVLATRAAAMSIAKGQSRQDNIITGHPLQVALDSPQAQALDAKIKLPGGESASAEIVAKTDESPPMLRFARTPRAGVYEVSWQDATQQPQSRIVCASPDKNESDLTPISDKDLAEILSPLDPTIVHYAGEASLIERGREIWRPIVIALLSLGMIESVFAVWVGRER